MTGDQSDEGVGRLRERLVGDPEIRDSLMGRMLVRICSKVKAGTLIGRWTITSSV